MIPKFVECVSCVSFFKNVVERLFQLQYRPSVISKLFESLINWGVLDRLKRNSLLNNKQYGFRSSTFTIDVLTFNKHRIGEALDRKFITRMCHFMQKTPERMVSRILRSFLIQPLSVLDIIITHRCNTVD